jgi:hypothetical protein
MLLPHRKVLICLLALIGLNAVAAGYGFMGTPDGTAVGIPQDWLVGTPFKNYMIPGAILFGLGVVHLCAGYYQFRSDQFAPLAAAISGAGLLIWIVVQSAMMGSFRHPAQTIMQATCLVIAIVTVTLAIRQNTWQTSKPLAST